MDLSKRGFEEIEGRFHDGLGTYAELVLANQLIQQAALSQPAFDVSGCERKMTQAIELLPPGHRSREVFPLEIGHVGDAAKRAATLLLMETGTASLTGVQHTAKAFAGALAGDVLLEFADHPALPVSVKTDKSGKVAVADGQTSDIFGKWAERYFRVSPEEFEALVRQLGHASVEELKSHYLHVAEFVAYTLISKLGMDDCQPTDFSQARATDLDAVQYLLQQLLRYKRGNDGSRVLIFQRSSGEVKWETLLDSVDLESLTLEQISFRPSRPKVGRRIGSEFCLKVASKAVVTFQIKHRRGRAHGTVKQHEFLDITTRLLT